MKQTIKLGYYYQLGTRVVKKIKAKLKQTILDFELDLVPLTYDDSQDAIRNKKIDILLTDPRDSDWNDLLVKKIFDTSLMVILAPGFFNRGKQLVELAELKDFTSLIVAKPGEEAAELHYQRDFLGLPSQFLGVNNVDEALLMTKSGSGYLLMNEENASHITSDEVQKLFLFKKNSQLKQEYALITNPGSEKLLTKIEKLL